MSRRQIRIACLTLTLLPSEADQTQSGRLGRRKSSYPHRSPTLVAVVKFTVFTLNQPKIKAKKKSYLFNCPHLDLKKLPRPFTVIWGDDWSVNLNKAIFLEYIHNTISTQKHCLLVNNTIYWHSYLEIWVNCCSSLTSYSQQGTKSISSTPEVRKLANVLKTVSFFDFKGKILKTRQQINILKFFLYILM